MEQKLISHTTTFSDQLNSVIRGIVTGGQSICQALADITKGLTKSQMTIDTLNEGILLAFICKNAETGNLHNEEDCSYTMIAKPFFDDTIKIYGDVNFEFQWNRSSSGILRVKLVEGTVLYYSGYGIMHRQRSTKSQVGTLFDHWNLSSYSNKMFYNCVRSSINRKVNPIKRKENPNLNKL